MSVGKKRHLLTSLAAVAIASWGGISILYVSRWRPDNLGIEVAKALLQVGVVAVIGAIISVLSFEYQQERLRIEKDREFAHKAAEYRESLILNALSELMTAYVRAKKARRLLRARGITIVNGDAVVQVEQYDMYLDWIIDAQLELENLARDIDTSAHAFSGPILLKSQVRIIEKYLKTLVTEYEISRPKITTNCLSARLLNLPLLDNFLQPAIQSKFNESVVIPYQVAQKELRRELSHPNLARPR